MSGFQMIPVLERLGIQIPTVISRLTVWYKKEHVRHNFSLFRRLFALRSLDLFLAVTSIDNNAIVGKREHAENK